MSKRAIVPFHFGNSGGGMVLKQSVLLLCCLFASAAFSVTKPLDNYWREIRLSLDIMEETLTVEQCYRDQRYFLACFFALDAAAAVESAALVPSARLKAEPGYGPEQADFGPVKIVGAKAHAFESYGQGLKMYRENRIAVLSAWTAVYQSRASAEVPFDRIFDWLRGRAYFQKHEATLAPLIMNAYLSVLRDPHTMILPIAYVRELLNTPQEETFSGIGVVLTTFKHGSSAAIVVESHKEGSPAMQAGLRRRDVITHVDGHRVSARNVTQLSDRLAGPKGSTVTLQVKRNTQTLRIPIVRDEIVIRNVTYKVIENRGRLLGYIALESFNSPAACQRVKSAIEELDKKKVSGLILDLRENSGGMIEQAVCIAGLFLGSGKKIVSTRSLSPKYVSKSYQVGSKQVTDLPLVTMIDALSASAAEIVAGALQDYRRSFLIGERSFGKATVQGYEALTHELVMEQTLATFHLPSGRTSQLEGVIPDLTASKVPDPSEEDGLAFREEDEYMAYPRQGQHWKQPRPDEISRLQNCVAANGTARQRFSTHKDKSLSPDYQAFYAEDALNCAIDLRIGTSSDRGFEMGNG